MYVPQNQTAWITCGGFGSWSKTDILSATWSSRTTRCSGNVLTGVNSTCFPPAPVTAAPVKGATTTTPSPFAKLYGSPDCYLAASTSKEWLTYERCSMGPHNQTFSALPIDPCPGQDKMLSITYQCNFLPTASICASDVDKGYTFPVALVNQVKIAKC